MNLRLRGLRELIRDLKSRDQCPQAVLLSEREKRDLKQEMLELAPLVRNGEHGPEAVPDIEAFCFIEGVLVMSDPTVPDGKAWLVSKEGRRAA